MIMTTNPVVPPQVSDLVFDPIQHGQATQAFIDYVQTLKRSTGYAGIPFGIQRMDQVLLPLLPIELRLHVALSGHTKTAQLLRLARWWADIIQRAGRVGEAVALVSAESPVEGIGQFLAANAMAWSGVPISVEKMARGEIDDAEKRRIEEYHVKDRKRLPLFLIGRSFQRNAARLPMHVDNIWNALGYLQEAFAVKLVYVAVDHLHALAPAPDMRARNSDSMAMVVNDNLVRIKDMNNGLHCAVDLGAQAKTEVSKTDLCFPDQYDVQWAPNGYQVPDTIISHNRPAKWIGGKPKLFEYIRDNHGLDWHILKDMEMIKKMVLTKICKQRNGQASDTVAYLLDPRYNQLSEMEEEAERMRTAHAANQKQVRPVVPEEQYQDADSE